MFAAGLVFGALVGSAAAADLPVKAPPLPVSTWDGWYLGGSVGWEQTNSTWTTTCFGTCPSTVPIDVTSPHSFKTSGGRVGGYFGVNWQIAPTWVVGAEADFGFFDKTSSVTGIVGCTIINCGGLLPPVSAANDSTSFRSTWDASIRARLGFLVTPAVLLYGTAGLASKELEANLTCDGNLSPWCLFSHNQTITSVQHGWTAGAGIDWKAYGNWIFRAEYRYSEFNNWSPVFFQGTVDEVHTNIDTRTHMVTFGVSYLFGGTGPVVSRY
jgi:outer membrane immunogenic protein